MGYVARVGDVVKSENHTYRIVKEINKGGFADAYKARREDGTVIFLKQYKSPSKLVSWFDQYFDYEAELNKRLCEDPVLKTATVHANELFLAKVYKADGYSLWTGNECIFQAFPFINGNTNLADMIENGTAAFDWEKKVYACAVFAFALRKLHDADVVHCDLKPENIQVKLDNTIAIKYRPLLIDMDWSILSDRKAPWHGKQGYVGTPGYTSPEHLRDEAPLEASDVFTASIIMCELLAGKHPFASVLGKDELDERIVAGQTDFKDADSIPFAEEVTPEFRNLLFNALNEDPKKRPTMEEIHKELMNMCKDLGKPKTTGCAELPTPKPEVIKAKVEYAKKINRGTTLTLVGDLGNFSTKIGFIMDQAMLKRISSSAKFADSFKQFELLTSDGRWTINSNVEAANHTCLNEQVVDNKSALKLVDGDEICLMGRSSGKKAMVLKVKLS